METLFEIRDRYRQLLQFAEDGDVDEEIFEETLKSIEDEVELKAENYVRVIKELEVKKGSLNGEIEVIQKEVDRRKAAVASIDNHIARMKADLSAAMIETDKRKFRTENFSFWMQATSEVVITDDAAIPMDFYTVPAPKVSKTKIKEALDKGEKLSFAKLETHEGVRFR